MSFNIKCNECGNEQELKIIERDGGFQLDINKFLISPFDHNDNVKIVCKECDHQIKEDCFGHYRGD